MKRTYLVVNAGSSSLKFALYSDDLHASLCHGKITGIGETLHLSIRGEAPEERDVPGPATHEAALAAMLTANAVRSAEIAAAGHRVVHGGQNFTDPVIVTPSIIAELETLCPLAPQHQPHNLEAIRALARLHPDLPQAACFDTAFHATQSPLATTFPIPRAITSQGVRRYGFHGLSYEFIAQILPQHLGARADGKVIVAHLGHGASLCAMQSRRSIATTMGFSALDGLMMGTRSGAIDPGVLLYLLEQRGQTPQDIRQLLYEQSGLLGVSDLSDNMRTLLDSDSLYARGAVALFVYRIVREIGSLIAALGGLDALVFTAGIGENAPEIRADVCQNLAWLGLSLDQDANIRRETCISTETSKVGVYVIATNEERVIANACHNLFQSAAGV